MFKSYRAKSLFMLLLSVSAFPLSAASNVQGTPKNQQSIEFFNSATSENMPFSDGVRVDNLIFLSGQIGYKAGKIVEGGIKAETRQALDNIKTILEPKGLQMKDVIKCTVMLADIAEWPAFNEVYLTYFKAPFPARSAFAASGLAFGARVEVECIAAVR